MRTTATLLAMALAFPSLLPGGEPPGSWQNLRQLTPGQLIEVVNKKGETVKGAFAGVTEDSLSLNAKQQSIGIPRAEIAQVRRDPGRKRRNGALVGLALGAGGGAGIGAAAGESLNNASGGDFASLRPAIIGACAGIGALVGTLAGYALGGRHSTVYRAP